MSNDIQQDAPVRVQDVKTVIAVSHGGLPGRSTGAPDIRSVWGLHYATTPATRRGSLLLVRKERLLDTTPSIFNGAFNEVSE